METLANMNRFVARSGEYYKGTRSEATAALVWSDTTANFYAGAGAQLIDMDRVAASSDAGNLEAEFSGLSEALLRAHAPFDVIDDTTLERESLARYKAIFLPNVACMSDAVAARLREYVRNGGRLFATFETGLYDDTGKRRPDFALAEDPLLAGVGREFLPASVYHVAVKSAGARALVQYMQPLKGRYDGVPAVSDDPALLVNSYGKGQAVFFTGDYGAMVANFHTPEFLELGRNLLRTLAPPPPPGYRPPDDDIPF